MCISIYIYMEIHIFKNILEIHIYIYIYIYISILKWPQIFVVAVLLINKHVSWRDLEFISLSILCKNISLKFEQDHRIFLKKRFLRFRSNWVTFYIPDMFFHHNQFLVARVCECPVFGYILIKTWNFANYRPLSTLLTIATDSSSTQQL